MSKVLRPNKNALAWLLSSVTNSPTAGSGNGACQPPWVNAQLADGILTVRLPKRTEAQSRKIEIKS